MQIRGFIIVLIILAIQTSTAIKLREKYGWKQVDIEFEDSEIRNSAISNREFIPENCVPFGIEVWRDKLFVSVPRRKYGIPSTLNYINLNSKDLAPLLKPYPNFSSNKLNGGKLTSVYRMNVDTCNRLWFVDTGIATDSTGQNNQYQPPKLVIFNLMTDQILKEYTLKQTDIRQDSSLTNLIVDVAGNSCDNAFAYITDLGGYGLIVFSLKQNDSWRIKHPYFYLDPLSTNYNIGGVNFQWLDGIFGVALTSIKSDGFRTLYFHPLSTTNEFAVSTKFLQDKTIANSSYHHYKLLGSRGPNSQASASSFDETSGVLFYPVVNKNAIGCWNAHKFPTEYSTATNGILTNDDETMIYASDLKVDKTRYLWFITNQLPRVVFSTLNFTNVNFRIFAIAVDDIIKGTVCDKNRLKHSHSKSRWENTMVSY